MFLFKCNSFLYFDNEETFCIVELLFVLNQISISRVRDMHANFILYFIKNYSSSTFFSSLEPLENNEGSFLHFDLNIFHTLLHIPKCEYNFIKKLTIMDLPQHELVDCIC